MQKTEFEIEVNETVAYSSRNDRFESYCPVCKCMTEMATVQNRHSSDPYDRARDLQNGGDRLNSFCRDRPRFDLS
jgi:hypothetical protein